MSQALTALIVGYTAVLASVGLVVGIMCARQPVFVRTLVQRIKR